MQNPYYTTVRPYVNIERLFSCVDSECKGVDYLNEFYFSSGRSALKWLLAILKNKRNKPLKIGVQVFTCEVVLDAILESGNFPVFFDIDINSFTTDLSCIDTHNIDVLILTHLFGIPNREYFAISDFCKMKGIFLIDDMALTVGAEINGSRIGYDSNVALFSFGFDKPISCYTGGMLQINDKESLGHLKDEFNRLMIENEDEDRNDLIRLYLYYMITDPDCYRPGLSYSFWTDKFLLWLRNYIDISLENVSNLLKLSQNIISRIIYYPFKRMVNKSIGIRRLGERKINYLSYLRQSYEDIRKERLRVAEIAKERLSYNFGDLVFPEPGKDIYPSWHRYPILAPEIKRQEVIDWGKEKHIELGAYNWGTLIYAKYPIYKSLDSRFPNSSSVVKRILNIPIWSEEIWNMESVVK